MGHELVQLLNPITKHWVVIDKTLGKILKHSRTSKPYKNITIVSKNKSK
jgi:hypothetical protein